MFQTEFISLPVVLGTEQFASSAPLVHSLTPSQTQADGMHIPSRQLNCPGLHVMPAKYTNKRGYDGCEIAFVLAILSCPTSRVVRYILGVLCENGAFSVISDTLGQRGRLYIYRVKPNLSWTHCSFSRPIHLRSPLHHCKQLWQEYICRPHRKTGLCYKLGIKNDSMKNFDQYPSIAKASC